MNEILSRKLKIIETSKVIYEEFFNVNMIMKSIEKGLKIQQESITNKCCKNFYQISLRYQYYPQVTKERIQKSGKTRVGIHSDFGTITLLFQKADFGQEGLLALNSEKRWFKVPPDYCMVVNLGDIFQLWTNDVLKSTIHKVEVDDDICEKLKSGELTKVPERQTVLMFCDPDAGQLIQCLPGFGVPKYEPIEGKKYTKERILALYETKT